MLVQSVLLALLAIPILDAYDRSAAHGAKKALLLWFCFVLVYGVLLRFVYPRLA